MFKKTSNLSFQNYGEVFNDYTREKNHYPENYLLSIKNDSIDYFYQSEEDVYLKVISGIVLLLVCKDINENKYEQFVVSQIIKINKDIFFNFISLTKQAEIELHSLSLMKSHFLKKPYIYNKIKPYLKVNEILTYFYSIKNKTSYLEELHEHFELTFVDSGQLEIEVDNHPLLLNQYDLILYLPNQMHIQNNASSKNCSYLTIIFDMHCNTNTLDLFKNKVFHVNRITHDAIHSFVKASESSSFYKHDALTNALSTILISLLNSNENTIPVAHTPMQQKFENELLSEILLYLHDNIYNSINVEDVCTHFTMSRSSLQALFKNNMNISPKQYMNMIKLEKSKALIKESKYTLSEISNILGFNSIHYFSKKFKKHYDISPSEYSKTIYN